MAFACDGFLWNNMAGKKQHMNTVTRHVISVIAILGSGVWVTLAQTDPLPPTPPSLPELPAATLPAPPVAAVPTPLASVPAPVAPAATKVAPATNAPTLAGPRIRFATPIYDFGRVRSGDPIKYSYIFTNLGEQTLEITHVQPSCGCTTAGEFSKKVEPGQTGSIPVQLNTERFTGQLTKTVTVTCNDKAQSHVVLQLKGTLWKPIEWTPIYPVLNVVADAPNASTTVKVVNNLPEDVQIYGAECNNPAIRITIVTNQPGKEYQLTIAANQPVSTGNAQAQVTIKTSATNMATVSFPMYITVQQPIVTSPMKLFVPPGPLANPLNLTVTIQNNSTNHLVLTEPSIDLPDVHLQIRETQPGRLFSVIATFPQGFQLMPGQNAALTVKSSNPKYPSLTVPVTQALGVPRPPQPQARTSAQAQPPFNPAALPAAH